MQRTGRCILVLSFRRSFPRPNIRRGSKRSRRQRISPPTARPPPNFQHQQFLTTGLMITFLTMLCEIETGDFHFFART